MPRRPCLADGCPVLVEGDRCASHRAERERERGTRQDRGYDAEHDRLRASWQHELDGGAVVWCWRCLERGVHTRIDPVRWDLGHDDRDPSRHRGPECIPCNRATAGRAAATGHP